LPNLTKINLTGSLLPMNRYIKEYEMDFDTLIKLVSSENPPRIRIDSRSVRKGDCFVAIAGTKHDGYNFIHQAIQAGSKYIVSAKPVQISTAELIIVSDTAKAAAILAQARNGNPAKQLKNLAVTGTNGKTTVAFLVRSIIQTAKQKCPMLGTVFYDTGAGIIDAPLTTPDCLTIAEAQRQMVDSGAEFMVIEASSHALAQNRLAAIDFSAAAFTNLTGDHLDYHKTETAYLNAKTILFKGLSSDATAVLNAQSPHSKKIADKTKARILYYAIDKPSDITAHIESMDINGTTFTVKCCDRRFANHELPVHTAMPGPHNVSNCLAAAGLCLAAGFDLETIAKGLSSLKSVPGRLEKVSTTIHHSPFTSNVFIDYAHTDDALKNVLSTLKPLCKGRLIVVFGCGGDRDKTKRPRMAAVAEQLADIVIVTSDNPRNESQNEIIKDITKGFAPEKSKNSNVTKIIEPDREKAVESALGFAQRDDIVLIAGKGHENYQIIGTTKHPFSDKTVVENYLKALV